MMFEVKDMKKFGLELLGFFFPRICIGCDKKVDNIDFECICKSCIDETISIVETYCKKCGRPLRKREKKMIKDKKIECKHCFSSPPLFDSAASATHRGLPG